MRIVREWALEYGRQLQMYKECEQYVDVRMELNCCKKEIRDNTRRENQNPLFEKNSELIKRYQS